MCTALWTEELEKKCFAPEVEVSETTPTTSETTPQVSTISFGVPVASENNESSQTTLNVGLVIVGVFALFGLS